MLAIKIMLPPKKNYAACSCIQLLSLRIQEQAKNQAIYMSVKGLYKLAYKGQVNYCKQNRNLLSLLQTAQPHALTEVSYAKNSQIYS